MTANQISYANLLEKQRSDRATEELRGRELEESQRATNLMRDTNLRQIEANVLNTEVSAAASRYGANAAAGASMYGAQQARAAAEYNTDTQFKMNERKIQADVELKSAQTYKAVTEANVAKTNSLVNFSDKLFGGIVTAARWIF